MGDRDTGHWPLLFMMSSRTSSSKSTKGGLQKVKKMQPFCHVSAVMIKLRNKQSSHRNSILLMSSISKTETKT